MRHVLLWRFIASVKTNSRIMHSISLLRRGNVGKTQDTKCRLHKPLDPTTYHSHPRDFIRNRNRFVFDEDRSTNLSFQFPFNGTYCQDTLDLRFPSTSSRPEASRIASPFRKSLLVSRIAFSIEGRTERRFARCEPQ